MIQSYKNLCVPLQREREEYLCSFKDDRVVKTLVILASRFNLGIFLLYILKMIKLLGI